MLSIGCVPRDWLAAHVIPVYKEGITSPVSLTCVMSKILERIIVGRIADNFYKKKTIYYILLSMVC